MKTLMVSPWQELMRPDHLRAPETRPPDLAGELEEGL